MFDGGLVLCVSACAFMVGTIVGAVVVGFSSRERS